jgi:predicted ATPase
MAHAALKSIHPINLLSFGPKTEPIELSPLNILIGPNGSGKSNFIEVIRLLHSLPDKDPWGVVLATGGVDEWIWKGASKRNSQCSLRTKLSLGLGNRPGREDEYFAHSLELAKYQSTFRIQRETAITCGENDRIDSLFSRFESSGSHGEIHLRAARADEGPKNVDLNAERSVFSQLASPLVAATIGGDLPLLFEMAEFFEDFDFHQDWEFGADSSPRNPQPVGQAVARLDEDGSNLAQMLAYYRDNHKAVFEKLTELVKRFYEPVKSVEVRLVSTHLEIAIEENAGFSTPGARLSDGMLRWLAVLAILLNPSPPAVTCIDEPELGFHPDIMPTLADLLREASTRTQLIVTTHSTALVDAFSDDPESVCVSEKIEGSTVIRRLRQSELAVWLKDYSLGKLWTSGEIGGNRW